MNNSVKTTKTRKNNSKNTKIHCHKSLIVKRIFPFKLRGFKSKIDKLELIVKQCRESIQ